MRKTSIGIISMLTIVLLVTASREGVAATYNLNLIDMDSEVHTHSPWADAYYTVDDPDLCVKTYPPHHYGYVLDIDNGDNVNVNSDVSWLDEYETGGPAYSGYHYFYIQGIYSNGGSPITDTDSYAVYTYPTPGGTTGSTTIEVSFTSCQEGERIDIYQYVYTLNAMVSISDTASCTIEIHLT